MKIKQIFLTTLTFLSLYTTIQAQVKIGDNPTEINTSAELEIESTDKGILLPRLTTAQRDAISEPAEGLLIYNIETKCLEFFNEAEWVNNCNYIEEPVSGVLEGVASCEDKFISITGCGGQTSVEWQGKIYQIVEIGEQCWFAENLASAPSNFDPSPDWVNLVDVGWNGYYQNDPQNGEDGNGKLYQLSAVLNNTIEERSQGSCPDGWHIPSDCEWMYLEKNLGMETNELELLNPRYSGSVGTKLSPEGESGFDTNYSGYRTTSGSFSSRDNYDYYFTSTFAGIGGDGQTPTYYTRILQKDREFVWRSKNTTPMASSVRCVKN